MQNSYKKSSISKQDKKEKRALIVDDDEQLRSLLAERLNLEGIEIEQAEDGQAALERLLDQGSPKFDAVLTDLNMPRLGGIKLIESATENGISIPFVILTGFADKEQTIAALKLGAFSFIEKPFKMDGLVATMLEAINYQSLLIDVDLELDELCKGLKGEEEQLNQVRNAQRALLILKRRRVSGSGGAA